MTHRLYINEYNEELIYQLSHNSIPGYFCTDESSENVLVVTGELEDLQKLCSLMYTDDQQKIKSVLPGFITKEDTLEDIASAFEAVMNVATKEIFKVINKNLNKTSYHLTGNEKWDLLANMYDKMIFIKYPISE